MLTQSPPDVAAEVRAAIGRARVKQSDLADQVGMHRSTMSRRLAGDSEFTIPELTAIANALGVELASLLPIPALAADLSTAATPPRDGGTPFPGDVPDPVAGDASDAA
jgi:transcriptional regulator with XRE-family HTH domain